jgi:outer membrane protein assembly factor BamB
MLGLRRSFGLVGVLTTGALATAGCSKSAPCGPGAAGSDAGQTSPDASAPSPRSPPGPASVLQEHLHPNRDGAYVDPALTKTAAARMQLQKSFHASYDGVAYAEPLYVDGLRPGQDALIVASWTNHVTALDATSGSPIWDRTLGEVVSPASLACSQPTNQYFGIMATPIIDPVARTLYVESFEQACGNHFVYALSIDDGSTRPGWPVDVGATVQGFVPTLQHSRAGLALLAGNVYVAFAGLLFDCDEYNGWVVGISTVDPTKVSIWSTTVAKGGIWGGLTTDGQSLLFSTGNSDEFQSTWGGQEAVFRLPPNLVYTGSTTEYFTPSNWSYLDKNDFDLGSASVIPFDLPGATPSTLVAALGKGGVLHILDRTNLGGLGVGNGMVGEGLYSKQVSATLDGVKGRLTSYVTSKGRYIVARTNGQGVGCPQQGSFDLIAMLMQPTSPPSFSVAWCAHSKGAGSPISTTTDGSANAIVWIFGAQLSQQLFGFDGDTGEVVFAGGGQDDVANGVWRFASPIVAKGRFFVAGEGQVYAFAAE